MTGWSSDELDRIEDTTEAQVAPRLADGSLDNPVTIWAVRRGDDIYVRSYKGQRGIWYREAKASHEGRFRAGGVTRDVSFVEVDDAGVNDDIDSAYRAKYNPTDPVTVAPMIASPARDTTMRLIPS
jgi:hypothetical protein